jgi:hypothetical protein
VPPSHGGSRRFESCSAHHKWYKNHCLTDEPKPTSQNDACFGDYTRPEISLPFTAESIADPNATYTYEVSAHDHVAKSLRRISSSIVLRLRHTMTPKKPRYVKFDVTLASGEITLYAGPKVKTALLEITADMTLYHGVRLSEVMQAVYEQGQKDGRKEIIEKIDGIKTDVNYLSPGRPKGKKKKSKNK